MTAAPVEQAIIRAHHEEWARVVAGVARRFGDLDLAEDAAAEAFVAAVERWVREQGCSELASDALLANEASHRAHAACGFEETERVVYFRKRLAG